MRLNPYLNFNGQCEAAFKFYEQCLGGKIEAMITQGGYAGGGTYAVSTRWRKTGLCKCRYSRPSGLPASVCLSINSAFPG